MEQAIEQLRSLPEDQQDSIAKYVLRLLANSDPWEKSTEGQADKLKEMIEEVFRDDAAGKCTPLDLDRL